MPKKSAHDKKLDAFYARCRAWRSRFPDGPELGGTIDKCENSPHDVTWIIDVIRPDIQQQRLYYTESSLLISDFPEMGEGVRLCGEVLHRTAEYIFLANARMMYKYGKTDLTTEVLFRISRLDDTDSTPVEIRYKGQTRTKLVVDQVSMDFCPPFPERFKNR